MVWLNRPTLGYLAVEDSPTMFLTSLKIYTLFIYKKLMIFLRSIVSTFRRSTFSIFLCSVFRRSVLYVQSFDFLKFDIRSFDVKSFYVHSLFILGFDVQWVIPVGFSKFLNSPLFCNMFLNFSCEPH